MGNQYQQNWLRALGNSGKRLRAAALCGAIAILAMGGEVGLAADTTDAEPGAADSVAADSEPGNSRGAAKPPAPMTASEKRALRVQKKKQWWMHARAVLLFHLELSEEQLRGVDVLIEEQLRARADFLVGDARFKAIKRHGTREQLEPVHAELREIKARLREPYELFEDIRMLLREEQYPTFDMNRARLVAEGQDPPKGIPVSSRRSPAS